MTSFAKRYEERKEEFRREVIDHYNNQLANANKNGKLLQVAEDSASQYLNEDNTEALVAKGALVASVVVGGIVAVATAVNAPSQLLSSTLFAASATLGVGVIGGLTYGKKSESERIEKLSETLFKAEISSLQDNPKFAKYMDILFDIAEGKGDKEFLKNTMLFSEEFTKRVIKEKNDLGDLMSTSQFLSKGLSNFNKKVIENMDKISEKGEKKAREIRENSAERIKGLKI